jgi:transposase
MRKNMKKAETVEKTGLMSQERSEGQIQPAAASEAGSPSLRVAPDPEVAERPVRRRFTAEYKLKIVEEADRLKETPGAIGALLRREGLYASHLANWREQRDRGALTALTPQKRGRKPAAKNPLSKRVAQLEAETRRLQNKLEKAEIIIDVQKKLAALLGRPIESPPDTGSAE